jgi:hypothetical protein
MNLSDLNSDAGAPATKPWLRPVVYSLEAFTASVAGSAVVTSLTSSGPGESIVAGATGPAIALKNLIAGPGVAITPSATSLTISAGGGGGSDWDVVPSSHSSTVLAAASYDYYINEQAPSAINIVSIRLSYSIQGSDSLRVAVYRGIDLTAVLVGQSAPIPAATFTTPWTYFPLVAVSGQNLSFARGENIVVAVASNGTTTQLRAMVSPSNSPAYSWANLTDSVASGFPVNPRAKGLGVTTPPCCRLIGV